MSHVVFRWPVRVYYEDTDSGGVVYYANYLRFLERARTEWLRSMGFEQEKLAKEAGLVFAVSRIDVQFLAPARLDDLLLVTITLAKQGRASLHLIQEIGHEGRGQVLVKAQVRIGMLNRHFRPTGMPPSLLAKLGEIGR